MTISASLLTQFLEKNHEEVCKAILKPEFEKKERVHDWRNHVPEILQMLWSSLSEEARLVAFAIAEQAADREEWD